MALFAQACGGSFGRVAEAETTAGGAFTLAHKPIRNTAYRAGWKSANSTTFTVSVHPRVRLAKIAPRRFRVRVFAARSFAGKVVVVQRYARARGVWVRVRRVTLRARGTGIAPTLISGATFGARVAARTRLRIVLGQAQVGACYVASRSNVVTV